MVKKAINQFLEQESTSSILLFIAAMMAMLWANSAYSPSYNVFTQQFHFVVNDGLMAIFFLLVGLELKKGFVEGKLSNWSQIALPMVGAVGGMLLPALIYIAFNYQQAETIQGWAIPVATDIAFALGALTLFGKRVPPELKLFLLALAIFDDVGAILIIAFALTKSLAWIWLIPTLILVCLLFLLNKIMRPNVFVYLLLGILLWFCVLRSGIHPTIAGVLLALAIPAKPHNGQPLLQHLERKLNPWVAFFIMPIFALLNAGFSLQGFTFEILTHRVVLGIALGLLIGKQVGVFGLCWAMIKLKITKLPANTSWLAFYGVALLCGIGFTMSLFLGTLSFEQTSYMAEVKLGVITGSILAGVAGTIILLIALVRDRRSVVD